MKLPRAVRIPLLTTIQVTAGQLGLLLAVPPGYATAVWPPSGIAVAALILWGRSIWPGIFLGAFLLNVQSGWNADSTNSVAGVVVTSVLISAGSTLQALLGEVLIRRITGAAARLDSSREVFLSLLMGGPLACIIGATVGVSVLALTGAITGPAVSFSWWTWWAGDSLGVMVFTPLLLLAFAPGAESSRSRLRAVAVPMTVSFVITVVIYLIASDWERSRIRLEFERQAAAGAEAFEVALRRNLEVLNSVLRFYATAESVDRDAFRRFLAPIFPHAAGLASVAWTPRVSQTDRPEFEASVRAEGFPEFTVTERAPGGSTIPSRPRGEYFPIRYVEPMRVNRSPLGFDVGTDSAGREALGRARDLGQPIATRPLTLFRRPENPEGVVVFQPVYRNDRPHGSVAERRVNLLGFANAVFQVGVLIQAAEKQVTSAGIGVILLDVTDPRRTIPMFPVTPQGGRPEQLLAVGDGAAGGVRWDRRIEVAGRQWMLRFEPGPDYAASHHGWGAWMVLAGGLLFTGLLQGFLLVVTGAAARTERLVSERTAELRCANLSLSDEMVIRQGAEAQALAAVRAKSEFLASMSHELRTPLNSVIGFTNVLLQNRESHLAPQEITWLQRVQANGRHLLGLINSILDLSKAEAGRVEVELGPVALRPLVEEVVAQLDSLIGNRSIDFRTEFPSNLALLQADEPRLRQILVNLGSNALKFTERGTILIRVVAEAGGTPVRLEVHDTGIGVPAHRHHAIFGAFEQADNSISRRFGGTGLGLAISRSLAELMGFRLTVESEVGVGSTFTLHFREDFALPPGLRVALERTRA